MSNDLVEANVELMNEKVRFKGIAGTNPPITFDYYPPLGDGEGYTGLEVFLISLAACGATSVLSIMRKMHKDIAGFQVKAKGLRREQHPTSFEKIFLQFVLDSSDVTASELQKAIQLSEETYCPVWAMIKNNVEVIADFVINSGTEGAVHSQS